jgi:uncharacterized protein (TIGR00304 family)
MLILHSTADEKTYAGGANQENQDREEKRGMKGGAVVMIGPIPIVVGSDSRTALLLMLMAMIMMIFWFIIVGSS